MKIKFILIGVFFSSMVFCSCSSGKFTGRYGENGEEKIEPKTKEIQKEKPAERKYENVTSGELKKSDILIDKENFTKKLNLSKKLKIPLTVREKLLFEIITYLETPYQWGGNSFSGIDCSALTQNIFNNALTSNLPRTVIEQYNIGEKIEKTENLLFGDLVFFNTSDHSNPGHVGVYLGEKKFIHSSQSTGVIVNSIDEEYYKGRYVGARRIVPEG